MDKMCQWLVEIFDGKVVHNCGPDDYIHPAILDVVDSMVENYPVWVIINSIIKQTFGLSFENRFTSSP